MGHSSTSAQKQTVETGNTFSGANTQRKMAAVPVLQKVESEEELPIQGVFVAQRQALEEDLPIQKKPNNTGMPDNLKSGVENLSGFSMSDVKVHYNSPKPAQLQALAYAQGTDIHVASGQEQHLPHEAWHVVQQKQGRVQPTMQMKEGVAVNDDKSLESEADVMGGKAMQMNRESEVATTLRENTKTASTLMANSYTTQLKPLHDFGHGLGDLNVLANKGDGSSVYTKDLGYNAANEEYGLKRSEYFKAAAIKAGQIGIAVTNILGDRLAAYNQLPDKNANKNAKTVDKFKVLTELGFVLEKKQKELPIPIATDFLKYPKEGIDPDLILTPFEIAIMGKIDDEDLSHTVKYGEGGASWGYITNVKVTNGYSPLDARIAGDKETSGKGIFSPTHAGPTDDIICNNKMSADQHTKLVGEGSRFAFLRPHFKTLTDQTWIVWKCDAIAGAQPEQYITFKELWGMWDSKFQKKFNISAEAALAVLKGLNGVGVHDVTAGSTSENPVRLN